MKQKILTPEIDEPCKEILNSLIARGMELEWCIDPDIGGKSLVTSENTNATITFRNNEEITPESILHELLHLDLFTRSYRKIIAKETEYEYAITIINDLFQHILMVEKMEEYGYFLKKTEGAACEKMIEQFISLEGGKSSNTAIDLVVLGSALLARAEWANTNKTKIEKLVAHMKKTEHYDVNFIKSIAESLPSPNTEREDYHKLQAKCINGINLANCVNYTEYNPTEANEKKYYFE